MNRARRHLDEIPWKFALPLFMGAVTTGLYYLNLAWLGDSRGWNDAFTVGTAQGIAALINGPGAPLIMNLTGQLLGAAIFWSWIGFFLDRRLRGIRGSTIRRTWLRLALYLVGLGLACWSFWSVARFLFYSETLKYLMRMPGLLLNTSPVRFVLGRDLMAVARLVWGFGFSIYFLRKLWFFRREIDLGRAGRSPSGLLNADG